MKKILLTTLILSFGFISIGPIANAQTAAQDQKIIQIKQAMVQEIYGEARMEVLSLFRKVLDVVSAIPNSGSDSSDDRSRQPDPNRRCTLEPITSYCQNITDAEGNRTSCDYKNGTMWYCGSN